MGTTDAATGLIEVRLNAIRFATSDVNLYEFTRTDGGPLPAAEPGAHIDLNLPNGLVRQYSLTEPNDAPARYVIGIKRDPASRGGSKYIFDALKVGTLMKISPPRNNFHLATDAQHVVMVAGGIGITPIYAMAQWLAERKKSFEMYYACRSRREAIFCEQLHRLPGIRFHFDDEMNGQLLDFRSVLANCSAQSHFYCCGPAPMLAAFANATRDIPPEQVHVEHFTAKTAASLEGGFTVRLAQRGVELAVPPGKSILELLREAEIDTPYSCEQGICGACETVVLAGTPDHRDSVLTEEERAAGRTMMICCSGSKSDLLTLDI